jgi:hypothetical protein
VEGETDRTRCRSIGYGLQVRFSALIPKRMSHERCVAILRWVPLRRTLETQRPGRTYAVGVGLGRLEGGLFRDRPALVHIPAVTDTSGPGAGRGCAKAANALVPSLTIPAGSLDRRNGPMLEVIDKGSATLVTTAIPTTDIQNLQNALCIDLPQPSPHSSPWRSR